MRTIIVPVNFSANAENAAHYAVHLALATGAEIRLVHVLPPPSVFSRHPMPDFVFNEMRDSGNLLLNRLSTELAGMTGGKVRINSDLQIGNVGPQLATYCKQYHPFLTVIGAPPAIPDSRYSSDDAIEAVKRLPYPLLIVPKNAFFYGAPKLVVACDDVDIHSGLRTASPFLKELRETLGTRVEIVHVVQNGESVTTVLEDYVDLKRNSKTSGPD